MKSVLVWGAEELAKKPCELPLDDAGFAGLTGSGFDGALAADELAEKPWEPALDAGLGASAFGSGLEGASGWGAEA